MKILMFLLVISLLLAGCSGNEKKDDFAKCLTEQGAVMYGAFWCPHCSEQKLLFGESFQYIKYVECSNPDRQSQTKACIAEGISSYPTWKFNGSNVQTGVLDFNQFKEITGCEI